MIVLKIIGGKGVASCAGCNGRRFIWTNGFPSKQVPCEGCNKPVKVFRVEGVEDCVACYGRGWVYDSGPKSRKVCPECKPAQVEPLTIIRPPDPGKREDHLAELTGFLSKTRRVLGKLGLMFLFLVGFFSGSLGGWIMENGFMLISQLMPMIMALTAAFYFWKAGFIRNLVDSSKAKELEIMELKTAEIEKRKDEQNYLNAKQRVELEEKLKEANDALRLVKRDWEQLQEINYQDQSTIKQLQSDLKFKESQFKAARALLESNALYTEKRRLEYRVADLEKALAKYKKVGLFETTEPKSNIVEFPNTKKKKHSSDYYIEFYSPDDKRVNARVHLEGKVVADDDAEVIQERFHGSERYEHYLTPVKGAPNKNFKEFVLYPERLDDSIVREIKNKEQAKYSALFERKVKGECVIHIFRTGQSDLEYYSVEYKDFMWAVGERIAELQKRDEEKRKSKVLEFKGSDGKSVFHIVNQDTHLEHDILEDIAHRAGGLDRMCRKVPHMYFDEYIYEVDKDDQGAERLIRILGQEQERGSATYKICGHDGNTTVYFWRPNAAGKYNTSAWINEWHERRQELHNCYRNNREYKGDFRHEDPELEDLCDFNGCMVYKPVSEETKMLLRGESTLQKVDAALTMPAVVNPLVLGAEPKAVVQKVKRKSKKKEPLYRFMDDGSEENNESGN